MTLLRLSLIVLLPLYVMASELEDIFQNPPEEAKPRGYWVWPHGNFDYSAIRYELQQFKAKGLGGVDIFDLGISDQRDVIPPGPGFMSKEQVDGIAFALAEAKKLGLKIGLIVSSSWNAGGSWIPPEHALMNLVSWGDTVQGPISYERKLPFPEIPLTFSKPYGKYNLFVPKNENGLPEFYQDVAVLVYPLNMAGILADTSQVQVFKSSGNIKVDIPAGRWIILRTLCTNFGQRLWLPSDNSQGLILDHFSKTATHFHFNTIIDRLKKRCGPLEFSALERLYLASYESDAEVIWTPTFAGEFFKRNNYRIEPFLPALFRTVVRDQETTERFLYDFRKTVSNLFIENFYREARQICHKHGLMICSEAGGPGPPLHNVPTEDLKALGSVDVMRGEFWNREVVWRDADGLDLMQVVKSIASAAHIYGQKIVEMEAFTSFFHWQEGPALFKKLADRAFCDGMNRVVYHTMSHHLPEAGVPGWTYQAGTHMSTNLTWWDLSDQLHAYLSRCSALLQQGNFVADACFYYGHDIPNFAKPKYVRPTLGWGYDYDDINTEILLNARTDNGQIVLNNGMHYEVLVLPDTDYMDLAVMQKIINLVKDGATIVGPKPRRIYGLSGYPEDEIKLNKMADELWGQDNSSTLSKKLGKGHIFAAKSVREILMEKGIGQDVEIIGNSPIEGLDFIHRRTEQEDIYFIRHGDTKTQVLEVKFRVKNRQPYLWDAVTGEMHPNLLFSQEKEGIRLLLQLEPQGSVFVIFKEEPQQRHITVVKQGTDQLFPRKENTPPIGMKATMENNRLFFHSEEEGSYELSLSDGSRKTALIEPVEEFQITGSWKVSFPHGWGATTLQTFDSLFSWTDSKEEATRTFSGKATYRKTFSLSETMVKNPRLQLDLGDVREIARVYLNGYELGISSFAPFTFDVTDKLRSGDNFLVIEVVNTWLNRLIADDQKPAEQRSTHTNLVNGPTNDKPWREASPKVSGLLGPVKIRAIKSIIIEQ
jgi:hypothetical protein